MNDSVFFVCTVLILSYHNLDKLYNFFSSLSLCLSLDLPILQTKPNQFFKPNQTKLQREANQANKGVKVSKQSKGEIHYGYTKLSV